MADISNFEIVDIPFRMAGNRQTLSGLQLVEQPWLRQLVQRCPNHFKPADHGDYVIYYPEGVAP